MIQNAAWIRPAQDLGDVCPVFIREFRTDRPVAAATLTITALGVYEAGINGTRVGSFVPRTADRRYGGLCITNGWITPPTAFNRLF